MSKIPQGSTESITTSTDKKSDDTEGGTHDVAASLTKLIYDSPQEAATPKEKPLVLGILALHDAQATPESISRYKKDLQNTIRAVRKYWFWELQLKTYFHFIDWKSMLLPTQNRVFSTSTSLSQDDSQTGTLFTQTYLADLLSYLDPSMCAELLDNVTNALNAAASAISSKESENSDNLRIVLMGHGLGGLLLHDILCNNAPSQKSNSPSKQSTADNYSSSKPYLQFEMHSLFLLGCPLVPLLKILKPKSFQLPPHVRVYNCFYSKDSHASRLETMLYSAFTQLPSPVKLPHWATNTSSPFPSTTPQAEATPESNQNQLRNIATATSRVLRLLSRTNDDTDTDNPEPFASRSSRAGNNKSPIRMPISPEKRYGTHDRKPVATFQRKPLKGASKRKSGIRRKSTTVSKLFTFFGLEDHENEFEKELITGKRPKENVILSSCKDAEDVDIMSEAETNAGLELPVRLDFNLSIAPNATYWNSHDLLFFVLKQVTEFYPVVAYPDFMKIFRYHEKINSQKSAGGSPGIPTSNDTSP